ncbi:putative CAAX amino terminal protease self-immunity protein, partial [Trachipleistophora hominis]
VLLIQESIGKKINTIFMILEDFSLYSCSFLVYFLYNNMLKTDFKKTWLYKYRLCAIICFDIVLSQYFVFIGNLKIPLIANNGQSDSASVGDVAKLARIFTLVIFGPFLEEIIFRRFLYQLVKGDRRLTKAIRNSEWRNIFCLVILITINSTLFALLHYDEHYVHFFPWPFLYFACGGVNLCLACELCDNIVSAVFMHIFFNFFVLVKAIVTA